VELLLRLLFFKRSKGVGIDVFANVHIHIILLKIIKVNPKYPVIRHIKLANILSFFRPPVPVIIPIAVPFKAAPRISQL